MEPREQILARMYVVLTLASIIPLAIVGQVLRIHFADGAQLREEGVRQYATLLEIPAMRGAIRDRAGRALAVNTARYDVALDPTVDGFAEKAETLYQGLARFTGLPASTFRERVRNRSSRQYVMLARNIGEGQKEELETWEIPGIILDTRYARRYNYGATAAHVLGHIGNDGHGLAGLEMQYDKYLRGEPGRRSVKRDRLGQIKAFVDGQLISPKHGESLVLTIDLIRQTILEEELHRGVEESGAKWGTAIAMDPRTGAVLAMANVPTYDPNVPGATDADPRRNRAITDRIEPGSTFKLVTAIAALEEGAVGLGDTLDTGQGWAVFGGRTMKDTHAHGRISFADVIAVSSNIGTAKTAQRLDPGVFYQYARNLGFGQPTWIDLPGEVSGVLKKPSSWSGTTLTSMSIGYEVDATPLQILTAYCALANGGLLVQPYVVQERVDVTGRTIWRADQDSIRRAFDRDTAEQLLPAFERAVLEGTATNAHIEGLRIAGKTGTARKVSGGSYAAGAYRATFVGFFPAEAPEVALIVILDEPKTSGYYGGTVAAPVFQRVARRWIGTFPKIAEQMSPDQEFPEAPERPMPDVTGRPAAVAARALLAAGHEVPLPPPDEAPRLVAGQRPAAGEPVELETRARLDVAPEAEPTDLMPDLTGLSARQAVYWMNALGVEVRLEGRGQVASQSPAPGMPLPKSAVLRCR